MLRCLIVAGDGEAREKLALSLEDHSGLLLLKTFGEFPEPGLLLDYVRAHAPQIVFFDVSETALPLLTAAQLFRDMPHVHLVAVERELDAERLLEFMNAGVREVLRFPFEPERLAATLARVESSAAVAPESGGASDLLYSFLPGKPGVGASTTAIHLALEISQRSHQKALLVDLDLNCGLSRFLLKLDHGLGVRDAVARASDMDEGLWAEIVAACGELDVLATGQIDSFLEIEPSRVRALLEYSRRRYQTVIVDHSGMMEAYSVDAMRQSRRVYLVVEPSLAAVHQAREKLRFLESQELIDRVSLVVNRWRKEAPLTIADIEEVLGVPAEATLSDAPEQVYKSTMRGGALDPASTYFREISDLANVMAFSHEDIRKKKVKRKIEYFSILPGRYGLSRG
jgi:pilus assembly protein CpaE